MKLHQRLLYFQDYIIELSIKTLEPFPKIILRFHHWKKPKKKILKIKVNKKNFKISIKGKRDEYLYQFSQSLCEKG